MSITSKLNYLKDTKDSMKTSLNSMGAGITDETFREYPDIIEDLYTNWPKLNTSGETLSLDTIKGTMTLDPKGNTSQVTYTGKNLANLSIIGQVPSISTGALVNFSGGGCTELIEVDNTKNYYLTYDIGTTIYVFCYDSSENFIGYVSGVSSGYNLNNSSYFATTKYVRIRVDVVAYVNWLQLEQNNQPTSYEPYVGGTPSPNPDYPQDIHVVKGNNTITITNSDSSETQTYQLNLPTNMELRKIGDYQDYFYKENDTWYKYSAINTVVLDGTEDGWSSGQYGTNSYYIKNTDMIVSPSESDPNIYILANMFRGVSYNNRATSGNNIIYADTNANRNLYIRNTSYASLTDFKTAIGTNNLIVSYVKATPTQGEIFDNTLINQLEALANAMSYNGTTNINQTNTDKPFMISVSVLKGSGV